jgi:hypothetical protein
MAKGEIKIEYGDMKTVAVNYKKVQIIKSPLTGDWFLFFKKDGRFGDQPPFIGTLAEMKTVINTAIKLNKGGIEDLLPENTYMESGGNDAKE